MRILIFGLTVLAAVVGIVGGPAGAASRPAGCPRGEAVVVQARTAEVVVFHRKRDPDGNAQACDLRTGRIRVLGPQSDVPRSGTYVVSIHAAGHFVAYMRRTAGDVYTGAGASGDFRRLNLRTNRTMSYTNRLGCGYAVAGGIFVDRFGSVAWWCQVDAAGNFFRLNKVDGAGPRTLFVGAPAGGPTAAFDVAIKGSRLTWHYGTTHAGYTLKRPIRRKG